jgi:hypothetical protein
MQTRYVTYTRTWVVKVEGEEWDWTAHENVPSDIERTLDHVVQEKIGNEDTLYDDSAITAVVLVTKA